MKKLLTITFILVCFNAFAQNEYDWELVFEKEGYEFTYIDMYDYLTGIAVGKNGLVMMTENGGESWVDYSNPDLGDIKQIDVSNRDTAFMTNGTDVFRTYNRGKDWTNLGNNGRAIIDVNAPLHKVGWIAIVCEDAKMYMSHTMGDKWYLVDNKGLVSESDELMKLSSYIFEFDTLWGVYSKGTEYRAAIKNFDKWFSATDPMIGKNTLMTAMNIVMDFHTITYEGSVWFGYENNYYYFLDNGTVSVRCSTAQETINSGSLYQIWKPDLKRKPGFAVGDNGYIMSHQPDGKSYGKMVVDNTSPTSKDLNWIDLGKGYNFQYKEFINNELTFMVVGDGVILRKRFEWEPKPVAVSDISQEYFDFKIFPNPSNGDVNLRLSSLDENTNVEIYGANGVLIQSHQVLSKTYEISGLAKGFYMVKVSNNNSYNVKRLVVQ